MRKIREWMPVILLSTMIAVALAATQSLPNQLTFAGMSTIYGFSRSDKSGLMRESDCSLTQYSFYPTQILTPATHFELTLHQLAGLSTTPDVFSEGCKDSLGMASGLGAYLGRTPNGGFIGVKAATGVPTGAATSAANQNLVVYVATPSSLSFTSTTLAQNVAPQVLGVDLNGDGKLDIIAAGVTNPATNQAGIAVYLGNGDGTFRSPSYYPMNSAANQAFAIDDLNGDGIPDILVPNTGTGPQVTALLGKGDGTFTVGPSTPIASISSYPLSQPLVTADVNGDGKKDLLTADGMLYLGNGDGSFGFGTQALPSRFTYFSAAFAVGDFNGDGKLDVAQLLDETEAAVATPPPRAPGAIVIYYGNGNGTFTEGPAYDAVPAAAGLVATDLDGDGHLDLAVARYSNGIFSVADHASADGWLYQILMGHGDGTFNGAPLTIVGSGPLIGLQQFPSRWWYATGDFNGDGKPDVLMSTQYSNNGQPPGNGVLVLTGNGDGSFATPILSTLSFVPAIVAAGDLNGDGKADAVAVGSGTVAVLFGNGDSTLTGEVDYSLPDGTDSPGRAIIGDFNGDGKADIAVAMFGSAGCSSPCAPGVYVLYGQAGGTFSPAQRVDSSMQPLLAGADINGDGRVDLVVADAGVITGNGLQSAGVLHVYLGQSNGQFQSSTPAIPALVFSDVAIADVNNDSKPDIVAAADNTSGQTQIDVLLGHGDGTFASAASTEIAGGTSDPAPLIAVADFNDDGNRDIAYFLANSFSGILFGVGDGSFSPQINTRIFTPISPGSPMALDLNGDQRADLLFADGEPVSALVSFVNGGNFSIGIPTFNINLSSASGSVTAGQSASTTVSLTPSGGFTGAIALSCTGLPAAATCNFSPASPSTNGTTVTSTLTIATTSRAAGLSPATNDGGRLPWLPGGMLLAGVLVPFTARRRIRTMPWPSLCLGMLACSVLVLSACSGDSGTSSGSSSGGSSGGSSSGGSSGGTPAGTYTVVVTATGGSITQTAAYTLTTR
jgi:hypothetical protein